MRKFKKIHELYHFITNAPDPVQAFQGSSPLLLLEQEIYYKEKLIAFLRNKYSDYHVYFGDELTLDHVAAMQSSGDLFSSSPLIIFRHLDWIPKSEEKTVIDLLSKKIEEGLGENLIILSQKRSLAAKLQKIISATGNVILCWPPFPSELRQWIAGKFRERGLKIQLDSLDLLLNRIGSDMMALENAIDLVSVYAKEKGTELIANQDVLDLFQDGTTSSVFDLLDSLFERKQKKSFLILHSILDTGVPEQVLISLLAKELQRYFRAILLLRQNMDERQISDYLGLNNMQKKNFFNKLRLLNEEKIIEFINNLVQIDLYGKTGFFSSIEYEFEKIFHQFLSRDKYE